jgi:hypothetical protein
LYSKNTTFLKIRRDRDRMRHMKRAPSETSLRKAIPNILRAVLEKINLINSNIITTNL